MSLAGASRLAKIIHEGWTFGNTDTIGILSKGLGALTLYDYYKLPPGKKPITYTWQSVPAKSVTSGWTPYANKYKPQGTFTSTASGWGGNVYKPETSYIAPNSGWGSNSFKPQHSYTTSTSSGSYADSWGWPEKTYAFSSFGSDGINSGVNNVGSSGGGHFDKYRSYGSNDNVNNNPNSMDGYEPGGQLSTGPLIVPNFKAIDNDLV